MCIITGMKRFDNIRVYAWLEFVIWVIIIAISVLGFRYYHYKAQKEYKSYQIFMEDVDGLLVGSPVKFLGVQIGYVKKIQIISSEVYVKFVITQKGFVLPVGSIATVEASGLGGSKSIEIYLPEKNEPNNKIIVTKDPTRLGKVMSLFDVIFKELDAIIVTVDHASRQFDLKSGVPKNVIEPVDANEGLIKINKILDDVSLSKSKFMKNFSDNKK